MTILTFIPAFVGVLSSLTLLAHFTHLIEEYTGGLLRALQKQDGDIHPILKRIWCHCFTSLDVNVTPVRNEVAQIFTSTYDNFFFQTAGIRDGPPHCAKNLSVFNDNLDTSGINDAEVIIKIDISNAFNTTCRALSLDALSGYASRDYFCVLKQKEVIESASAPLSNMFGYFHAMRTCRAKLRCFD